MLQTNNIYIRVCVCVADVMDRNNFNSILKKISNVCKIIIESCKYSTEHTPISDCFSVNRCYCYVIGIQRINMINNISYGNHVNYL